MKLVPIILTKNARSPNLSLIWLLAHSVSGENTSLVSLCVSGIYHLCVRVWWAKCVEGHNWIAGNLSFSWHKHCKVLETWECCGQKERSDSSWSASYGKFIEQTVTVTSVCDNSLYLSTSFSVYVAQTQSLFGACCLRTILHLRRYLDRVHSDLSNMLLEQCQGSPLPHE